MLEADLEGALESSAVKLRGFVDKSIEGVSEIAAGMFRELVLGECLDLLSSFDCSLEPSA